MVLKHLELLERKLQENPEFGKLYHNQIEEYIIGIK